MFSLQQNWRRGQNKFCLEAGDVEGGVGEIGGVAQTIHMSVNVKMIK
jgi:hypothetical protein